MSGVLGIQTKPQGGLVRLREAAWQFRLVPHIGGGMNVIVNNADISPKGEDGEMARVELFLCSEQASYVNGAATDVNGGQHA